MYRLLIALLIVQVIGLAGCRSEAPNHEADPETRPPASVLYDRTRSGSIRGRLTWTGPIPEVPGFLQARLRPEGRGITYETFENPNRPRVDPQTRALADAVVFLRPIHADRAKPWNLPPVRVRLHADRIEVVQGGRSGRSGFVKRGEGFVAETTEAALHLLRARGDAFLSLAIPGPDRPVARTLTEPGCVELSSGTGIYWARAYLFVGDAPYFTHTDAQGSFDLSEVPEGQWELVVWHPGWLPVRQERDPDRSVVVRLNYSPPLQRITPVKVVTGRVTRLHVTLP